jgi:hypothetical protein
MEEMFQGVKCFFLNCRAPSFCNRMVNIVALFNYKCILLFIIQPPTNNYDLKKNHRTAIIAMGH